MRWPATLVIVSLCVAAPAWAQSASGDAEKLFRDGKALMDSGDFAKACEAFEGSYRKDPTPSTLLNLANCREKNHQLATAWGHFIEAARQSGDSTGLKQSAQERAAKLEPRLSYLIINMPDEARIDGLEITRNGKLVDRAEWNRDMPVDGGSYEIAGKAPAYEAWSTTVTVDESGDKQSVNVPRFREVPAALGAVPATEPTERPSSPSSSFTGRRKLAIAAWAAGAVGLGAGLALELSARGAYDDAKAATDNPTRDERYDTANQRRLIGAVAAGAGAAIVVGGVVLWITGNPPGRSSVAVLPVVDDGMAGLAISGSL